MSPGNTLFRSKIHRRPYIEAEGSRVKPSALLVSVLLASLALSQSGSTQSAGAASPAGKLNWLPWSDDVFSQAKREQRFVLLDLEAVWCHWCHVMDVSTYRDPKVLALLHSKYLTVRVDQDSRPDLSNRYEDYGWPATVVFNAEGGEIVKRQGYIPPAEMISMLQAIIADPSPGPSVKASATVHFQDGLGLTKDLRERLRQKIEA